MRISELSWRSGVSIATIKFYLRQGLLPPGRPTAQKQAVYDDSHLSRIYLIRILTGVGGMSISSAREVLRAVDDRGLRLRGLCEVINKSLFREATLFPEPGGEPSARVRVDEFLADLGWEVPAEAPGRQTLAQVLTALRGIGGGDIDARVFAPYARAAAQLALAEADAMPAELDSAEVAAAVAAQAVLFEVALVALRRMVLDHVLSAQIGVPEQAAAEGNRDRATSKKTWT